MRVWPYIVCSHFVSSLAICAFVCSSPPHALFVVCPPVQSAQNRLLVKGGKVVNDDGIADGDVYVEDGIIKQVGRNLIIPGGTRVIDARGKLIMPGKSFIFYLTLCVSRCRTPFHATRGVVLCSMMSLSMIYVKTGKVFKCRQLKRVVYKVTGLFQLIQM